MIARSWFAEGVAVRSKGHKLVQNQEVEAGKGWQIPLFQTGNTIELSS